LREIVASLAQATAELARERGERRRAEQRMAGLIIQLQSAHRTASEHLDTDQATQNTIAELEKRLAERDDALTRLHAQLEREAAEKRSAEELLFELNAVGEQAQKNLTLYEEAKRTFAKTQEQLENRLQGLLGNLSQVESKLKIEASERRRTTELLEESERRFEEQNQKKAIEASRLQTALQVEEMERRRLESELARARQASMDAERTARLLVNGLRKQTQEPVDALYLSACTLLESELSGDSKRLAETVLEKAILLKTRLQEVLTAKNTEAVTG